MSIQTGLLRLVEHSRGIEREFLADLTQAEREAVGSDTAWTAKDLVAHLAEWRRRGAEEIEAARRGETVGEIEEIDPLNREIFDGHRHLTWDQVLDLSERAWESFSTAVGETTDDLLRSTDLTQSRRPIWRRLTVDAANHPALHLSEYARAHGRPQRASRWMEGLTPKLLDLDASNEWHGAVHYNLACHYALAGQAEEALASLETALRLRPDLREWSTQDPDLASLRGHSRFQPLPGG
jgi:hypothetical protein